MKQSHGPFAYPPRKAEPIGFRWLTLFAALATTLTVALIVAGKLAAHTAALTCGAC